MATELVSATMGDRTPNGSAMVLRHPVCLTISQGGDMPTDVAQTDPGVRDRRLFARNRDTSGVFGGPGDLEVSSTQEERCLAFLLEAHFDLQPW